jgi:hypothetical protein
VENAMIMTLEVSTEVEERLSARARARGISLTEYVRDLVDRDAREERILRGFGAYRHLPHGLDEFERECSEEKLREDHR